MDLADYDRARITVNLPTGTASLAEFGEGPVALFIHGVFMSGVLWRNTIDQLSDIRRCVAVDLPAHGQTIAGPDQDLSLPELADWVHAVCVQRGYGPVDVVANDTGGAIAQVLAAHHPELVRTLTLTNCDAHDNLPPSAFKDTAELAGTGALAAGVSAMVADLDLAKSEVGMGIGYERPRDVPDEIVLAYLAPLVATDERATGFERYVTSLDAADLLAVEDKLRAFEAPVLVVWGTGDRFFEVHWAYWLRDLLPGTKNVVELDGGMLFFPDERADEFAREVRRFWVQWSDAKP